MDAAKFTTGLARDFARSACPDDFQSALENCFFQADILRIQTLNITAHKNFEVLFLADLFEVQDEFASFSDVMAFWARARDSFDGDGEGQERLDNPRAFRMLDAARSFSDSFDRLPRSIQGATNLALALHKALIVAHIQDKSVEFVREGFEP